MRIEVEVEFEVVNDDLEKCAMRFVDELQCALEKSKKALYRWQLNFRNENLSRVDYC
jgi:hypothetical protein